MRTAVLAGCFALVALSAGACGGETAATGLMSISVAYVQPPPGAPMSIGGSAVFAHLVGPDGSTIYNGEVNPRTNVDRPTASARPFELAGGDYELEVRVLMVSDAVSIDQNGNMHFDYGPVSATCSATVRISPPALSAVVVTLAGGSSCSIALAG